MKKAARCKEASSTSNQREEADYRWPPERGRGRIKERGKGAIADGKYKGAFYSRVSWGNETIRGKEGLLPGDCIPRENDFVTWNV